MKSQKLIRSIDNRGIAALALTVIVSLIVGVLIALSSQNMNNLLSLYSRHRNLYDSTLAVEKFAVALKAAYDKATPYGTELIYDPSTFPLPGEVCNKQTFGGYTYVTPGGTSTTPPINPTVIKGINLCWNFRPPASVGGTANKLCFERALGLTPICIESGTTNFPTLPSNLFVQSEEPSITWKDYVQFFFENLKSPLLIPEAEAAAGDMQKFRPAIPSNTSNEIEYDAGTSCTVNNITTAACKNFRTVPKDINCLSSNVDCIHFQLCLKHGGSCKPEEFVKQTLLFFKKPDTVLGE